MLFIFDNKSKTPVYSAVILLAGGIGAMALVSPHGIDNFTDNVYLFFEVFWPVLIILAAVILLINKDSGKQS